MRAKLVKENIDDLLRPKSKEDIIRGLSKLTKEEKNIMLINASREGYKKIVELLLKVGADVNAKNFYGSTPLIYASMNGNIDIVKMLIEVGVDVNAKNKFGNTALMCASFNGHKKVVDLLKRYGTKE